MLNKTETSFSILFFIIVATELICGNLESLYQLHYFTKPLVLISLIFFFLKQSEHLSSKTKMVMLLALLLSLLGDVLLMFVDESANLFIGGLVAFLLAHVMYILVFLKSRNKTRKAIPFTIILFIYALGLFYLLKNGLGDMLIPVIAYVLVILTMVVTAFLRKGSVASISYNLVFVGALFFMISDSFLAVNKFYHAIPMSNILIMSTYAIAQYIIVMGVLKQKD